MVGNDTADGANAIEDENEVDGFGVAKRDYVAGE
jgi:hypothetical protein